MARALPRQVQPRFKQVSLETLETTIPAALTPEHSTRSTSHKVKLTLHPSKIHLNQRQTLQISQLNQQIQSLKLKKPDPVDFDKQILQINIEIDRLHQRIAALQEQIDSTDKKRRDYEDQNAMVFMDRRTRQNEIDELMKRRTEIDIELEKIEMVKKDHSVLLSNVKRIYGIATVGDGFHRIDEIDERIERETLTASQLRKLLAEKDRIQKGITFLNQSAQLKPEISPVTQNENQLHHELREILTTLHQLIEERNESRKDSGDVYDNFKKMQDEKKQFMSELKEARIQLDQKYDERAQMTPRLEQSQKDYEHIQHQILTLEDQKLAILAEAEITTLNERDEQRKIKAVNSLIHCLQRFNQNANSQLSIGKHKAMQDDLNMIARLRKPSKKSGQIPFDIETRKLFDIIGIPIPLSFNDVPATLTILHDMANSSNLSEPLLDQPQPTSDHQHESL
jgi:predicted  nucleic acid-binding Zn-ribbon protein